MFRIVIAPKFISILTEMMVGTGIPFDIEGGFTPDVSKDTHLSAGLMSIATMPKIKAMSVGKVTKPRRNKRNAQKAKRVVKKQKPGPKPGNGRKAKRDVESPKPAAKAA